MIVCIRIIKNKTYFEVFYDVISLAFQNDWRKYFQEFKRLFLSKKYFGLFLLSLIWHLYTRSAKKSKALPFWEKKVKIFFDYFLRKNLEVWKQFESCPTMSGAPATEEGKPSSTFLTTSKTLWKSVI